MAQSFNPTLQQAIELIRKGQLKAAQPLLVQVIKQQPNSEDAWYWLSFVVSDQRQQIDCLQRVLRINPANKQAQARLVEIMAGPAQPHQPSLFTDWQSPASAPPPVAAAPVQPIAPVTPLTPAPAPEPVPAPPSPPPEPEPQEMAELRTKLEVVDPEPKKRSLRLIMLLLLIIILIGVVALFGPVLLNRMAAPAPQVINSPTVTFTPTITAVPSATPTLFPATWTPTPPPTALPSRTPTPPPAPEATVDAGLLLVQQQVSTVRGLPADVPVARYLIPAEEAERALSSMAAAYGLLDNLPDQTRVLSALGLILPNYDLTKFTLNRLGDPIGVVYHPERQALFLIGQDLGVVERNAYAFGYDQAATDQRYLFGEVSGYPACQLDSQQCEAVRALIKGDAVLAASQWQRRGATAAERQIIANSTPPETLIFDELMPQSIRRLLSFPYEAGAEFVQSLFQRGGWPLIDRAYTEPPQSTEHILHPDKYQAREQPLEVSLPPLTDTLGSDWRLIADDVLGEWLTSLVFSSAADIEARLSDAEAAAAARGWGGDRFNVYVQEASGATILIAQWVADAPADATRFRAALRAYLNLRFDGARLEGMDDCWISVSQVACIQTADNETRWVLTPDRDTMTSVQSALP